MKLATYKDGSGDSQRVVVSRNLSCADYPTDIAHRLPRRFRSPRWALWRVKNKSQIGL